MPHYFEPDPAAPSRPTSVRLTLPDLTIDLTTDRGVFSRSQVDAGTRLLLLEAAPPPNHGALLDLGCGYGPIALTMARRAPTATVWAVDVNRRALALTAANATAAGLGNVRVAEPDDVPDDLRFGAIWSNPAVRTGKDEMRSMLLRWLGRLTPDGTATLVVQRHLGADSLAAWLGEQGWGVQRRCSRVGYRLLEVRAA